jgi:hypothetical protein
VLAADGPAALGQHTGSLAKQAVGQHKAFDLVWRQIAARELVERRRFGRCLMTIVNHARADAVEAGTRMSDRAPYSVFDPGLLAERSGARR